MLVISRINEAQWEMVKAVRLAALQEAPYAFSTQYTDAVQRNDKEWQDLAATRAVSDDDSTFLAFADGNPIGMAGGYRKPDEPELMHLVAVWVAPERRGSGVADLLIEAVCVWAHSAGATRITAWVAEGNDRALRVYNRLGFVTQPDRQPYPPNPALCEILTVRPLDAPSG